MAVVTGWRGLGAGRLLIDAAIAHFERRRGKTLFLESNSELVPALGLYESAGFVRQPGKRSGSHYRRSDVYMIYRA
jgi:ribosomal protein S18 acetylase RimI-like enzyme